MTCFFERADCLRAVHRYDDALKDLQRAVELDPSNKLLCQFFEGKDISGERRRSKRSNRAP